MNKSMKIVAALASAAVVACSHPDTASAPSHVIASGGVELRAGQYVPVRELDGVGGRRICKYGELSC